MTQGGYEYNAVLAAVGAGLAFTGAGRFSLDNALGLDLSGNSWGTFAVALGLATAASVLASRRSAPVALTAVDEDKAAA